MRIIDIIVLVSGILFASFWILVSSRDGYKANNAIIAARSISVVSTIDGQVSNDPPSTGSQVSNGDVLLEIHNSRIDRSKFADFQSQVEFLISEISNVEAQQVSLNEMLSTYLAREQAYSHWLQKEAEFKAKQTKLDLEVAQYQQELAAAELDRAARLSRSKLLSNSQMQTAQTVARVAEVEVLMTEMELERSNFYIDGLLNNGAFFNNGDTSYWSKMADSIRIRLFENSNKIATMKLQLIQAQTQASVEKARIESSLTEVHRAPFDGMINASFVTKDTRVTAGTSLYQVLDCKQPVIIIPIPDNRISEFSVGLRVTVYPTDTAHAYKGKISYVTSGALIGADKSLQVQQGLIIGGNRAIVSLDDELVSLTSQEACETERKAVVVIHTSSWYTELASWIETKFTRFAAISD